MSREFTKVGVVGLGTMGAGIAEVFARNGLPVVAIERDEAAIVHGLGHIEHSTARAVARGKLTAAQQRAILERIDCGTDLGALADVDLVVEAVPEHLDLKRAIFARMDEVCKPDTILATNTSSLSVTEIAVATHRPGKVIGLHFFNPAPVMKLVEIIRSVVTEHDVVDDVEAFAQKLGKVDVTIGDRAGFIANALLFGYLNHAADMYESHYATREDIDVAMTLGCGLPMGPLALIDLIGLDTSYEILDTMYEQTRNRLHAPTPILKQMITAGLLGRKVGRGFYTYDAPDSPTVVEDATVPARVPAATPRRVERVGVVGSGVMATGIVEVLARGGYDVTFVARSSGKAEQVRAAVARSMEKAVQRGKLDATARDAAIRRITSSVRLDDLADAHLVDRGRGRGHHRQAGTVLQPGRDLRTRGRARHDDLEPPGHPMRRGDVAARRRDRHAFLQSGGDHAARRGRVHGVHDAGYRGHRARGCVRHRQASRAMCGPGRLHRQRAALPVPERRGKDAGGALRDGR